MLSRYHWASAALYPGEYRELKLDARQQGACHSVCKPQGPASHRNFDRPQATAALGLTPRKVLDRDDGL